MMDMALWEALANRWISVQSEENKKSIGSFISGVAKESEKFRGAKPIEEELLDNFWEDENDIN